MASVSPCQVSHTFMTITCTNCVAASFRKAALVFAAQARAISVFPVPGGPYMRTPNMMVRPTVVERQKDHTFRGLNSDCIEEMLVSHRSNDGLYQFLDLFVQTTDITVVFGRFLVHFECFDPCVVLCWELVQHQVAVLVHTNKIARLHLFWWHQPNHRKEHGLQRDYQVQI